MTETVKVKDSPELVRDISSRAILNTDKKGLQNYNMQRQKILDQKKEQQLVKTRLDNIENQMSEIKELMRELLLRSTNGD
jgi:hypothetical protein